MSSIKQVPSRGYCPAQKKEYLIHGNYVHDGFGGYALGTVLCQFKKDGGICTEKPCPLRSKLPESI